MNICKRTIIMAAGAVVAALAVTGPASASTAIQSVRFALTPNQFIPGRHIRSVVTGRVDGAYSLAFFASTGPNTFIVPRFFSGPC
jgi:hypothetical protein